MGTLIKWVVNEPDDDAEITIKKWKDAYRNNKDIKIDGNYFSENITEIHITSTSEHKKSEASFFILKKFY